MEFIRQQAIAGFIVRVALGLVFLYASIGKLYFSALPPVDRVLPFIPLYISVFLLGLLEFVLAILLLAGFITRIAAWISAALLVIFLVAGLALGLFNAAGLIKDIGLLGAAISTALLGCTIWGIDCLFKRKASLKPMVTPLPVSMTQHVVASAPQPAYVAPPIARYYASKDRPLFHTMGCFFLSKVNPQNRIALPDLAAARMRGLKPCECVKTL